MADNIRTIKTSFNTLSNSTTTRNTHTYLPNTALTKEYYSTGALNLISDTAESVSLLAGTANVLPEYLLLGTDVTTNGLKEDYENLSEQLRNQTNSYLTSKVNRIKSLWNKKVDVTVESLLGEVSAYAMDMDNLGSNLVKKLTSIAGTMTGTNLKNADSLGDVVSALGSDYFTALTADGSLNETINNLNSVKTVASTLSSAVQIYNTITQLKKIYEGLSNTLSIASNFALSFWSGGATAVESVNTIAEVAQINISKLRTMVLYTVKKFLFPMKIKVPALLVGDLDSINVRQAMLTDSDSLYNRLFNKDYYDTVQYTEQWANAIEKAVSAVKQASNDVQVTEDNYEKLFKNVMTDSYMNEITAMSRKTAGIQDFPTDAIQKSQDDNSSTKTESAWQALWGDKSKLTPITSVESLVKVSATLYEAEE